ncbi:hypothetical protein DUT91_16300 [Phyllobacterium salinisoli]|uniref:Uncharacterized protein n=1 Tax=Phyllobacterium salinisoli TaxID=1899321 RepID=A0A368K0V6_9HYPH|nr:hypothetical protein [Phyllobacterium salinisoli]RCS23026.1 hypothetical protein DUT91_16300 [Phyllobacterium salinisoli]
MNRGEFERLKVRFGVEIAAWPAPYHREALIFLTADRQDAIDENEKLDRLILEAATAPTDEHALARAVIAQIGRPKHKVFGLSLDIKSWSMPAMAASMVVVLMVSAIGGYMVAGVETEISDNELMAFAVGGSPTELAETIGVTQNNGGHL